MRRIVIALVVVTALAVPSFSSSAVAPMELRCSNYTTVIAQRDGTSHDWNVTYGSVFHSVRGSVTAPDGRVVERWEDPTASRGGFITCFGTVSGYQTEMEGSFTP